MRLRATLVCFAVTIAVCVAAAAGSGGSAVAASGVDITGTWSCCGSGGAADQTWAIAQSGSGSLSGSASNAGSGTFASISGSVSGSSVTIVTTYAGSTYVATFTGSVSQDGGTMSGNWSSNASQSGTWTASLSGGPPSTSSSSTTTSTTTTTTASSTTTSSTTTSSKRKSVTQVICNLDTTTNVDDCGANVADASGQATLVTPTGNVTFSSTEGGTFLGSVCQLLQTPFSPGVASCVIKYRPAKQGFPHVTATYPGDATFAPSSGMTSLLPGEPDEQIDCDAGCANLDLEFGDVLDPGDLNFPLTEGCGVSAAQSSLTSGVSEGACTVTSGITVGSDLGAALAQAAMLSPAARQQVLDTAGVPKLDPTDVDALPIQQQTQLIKDIQDALKQAIQNMSQASSLETSDSDLAGDFSDSASASAAAAAATATAPLNVASVMESISATHPTSADATAFGRAVALATAPDYSPQRAAARLTLYGSLVIGRRALARDLKLKSFAALRVRDLPKLGTAGRRLGKHKRAKLSIRPTALGGRFLRLLEIAGLGHKTTVTEKTKGKPGTHTLRKTIRVR